MDPELAILKRAVDDSAIIYRTVFITFLTIITYFFVVSLSIEHEALFKNAILKAPILNIGIKTYFYFKWTPFILLFVHLGLLTQAHILNKRAEAYIDALHDLSGGKLEDAEIKALGLLPPLPLTQIAKQQSYKDPFGLLLWLLVIVTLILMPVCTLGVILFKFLPYQDWMISSIHWYALVLSLVMLSLFFIKSYLHHTNHKPASIIATCVASVVVLIMVAIPPIISYKDFNLWKWDFIEDIVTLSVPRKRLYLKTERSPLDVCMEEDKTLGLDLKGRSYINADLSGAILCHAILENAKLQGANLENAKLQGANLENAKLQGASLLNAKLQGASLLNAKLQGANLSHVQLQGANLENAKLQGANLSHVQLQGANLENAKLQGANLKSVQLQGASLLNAQLQGANLLHVQLQGANLGSVQLQEAHLFHVQLQGASSVLSSSNFYLLRSGVPNTNAFKNIINDRIDKDSDFSSVVFAGGLNKEEVAKIAEDLKQVSSIHEEERQRIIDRLERHTNLEVSHELPEGAIATSGRYMKEEAEQWIKDYYPAMEVR